MMSNKKLNFMVGLSGLLAATLPAVSCTPQQLNAFVVGVNALADAANQQDDDISFFDWLEQELDD